MGLNQISMLQIDYFLAVANHLNFTEAAKSLYISQPSISKQIAIFERELGVQLFFRTKRSVQLTPAGVVLLKELTGINERIMNAFAKAKQPNLGENSSLTIGCLDAMNTDAFLGKVMKGFKTKYHGVSLALERHSFKILREKLINGSLDLIFTMSFEWDESLGIIWEPVLKADACILMSSFHPLADRENLTLEELKNEDFVLISREESPHGFDGVIKLCQNHGFSPNVVKQLPNVESLLLSVESGIGVSIFDSTIRLHNNSNFKLFKIADDQVEIGMAWKKENLNPAIPLFVKNVLE